jgi:transposase
MARGRRPVVTWAPEDTAAALQRQARQARDAHGAKRLRALALVRTGQSLRAAAKVVDADERTVGVWLRWYREGGLAAVRQHRQAGKGRTPRLTGAQQAALRTHLCSGAVYTVQDALAWVTEHCQVTYRPKGMYSLLKRLQARPKVPRPHNPKSTAEQQAAWKKGDSPTPSGPPASPWLRG